MSLPTASKVERVMACPASWALPQVIEPPGEAALAGTARHEALAAWVDDKPKRDLPADVRDWLEVVTNWSDFSILTATGISSEVAFAYDVLWGDGRKLGRNIGRAYDVTANEIAGSADYLRSSSHGLAVYDLKTGRGEVTEPKRNPQLLTLALAASRDKNYSGDVIVGLLLAPDGQNPRVLEAKVTQSDLVAHGEALARMVDEINESRQDVAEGRPVRHVREGAHCRYCPARLSCPARTAQADALTVRPQLVKAEWAVMLEQGRRAEVYAAWRTARELLAEVGDALHASASAEPIDLGDGRKFGPREVRRTVIDAEAAWPLLSQAYGADIARAAMTLETSKAGVKRAAAALKAAGHSATKAALERDLLALLAPATEVKTVVRIEESTNGNDDDEV